MEWWKEFIEIPLEAEGESAVAWVRPVAGKFEVGVRHRQATIWSTTAEAEQAAAALSEGVSRFEAYVRAWKVLCSNPSILKPISPELARGYEILEAMMREDDAQAQGFDPVAANEALARLINL